MMEIVGRYMLTERLARGGAAEVFRARAHGVEGFRKAVAVKRLRRDVPADAAAEARFAQAASLALSLQHANIVQAFDFGTTPSEGDAPARHYLVMELVEGITLGELLTYYRATRGRMPLSVGAFVGAEIARALDYAHRRTGETGELLGLVHRDLSPANVMLSVEGEVKVTDFGAPVLEPVPSQLGEEATNCELRLTTVAGTSAYMSPEQARGEPLTAASDVYSLGTIVYECLTGSNPFADTNPVETQRRVRASEVPPPELLYPDAPEALLAVLRAAMIADAAARTQRAGLVADELTWLCFEDADCSPSVALAQAVEAAIRYRTEPVESSRAQTPTNPPPPSMPLPSERVSARRVHATVVVVLLGHGDVEAAERSAAALEHAAAHIMLRDAPRVMGVLLHEDGAGDELERAVRSAWWISLEGQDDQARVGVASGIVTLEEDGIPRGGDELAALSSEAENAVPEGECGVFISPAVATAVRHAFRIDKLLAEQETYRVLEAYGLNGRMGPFCGHRTELRTLWESLSRAAKGTTEILHIKGPTGIGKTRLLLEHAARASLRLPDLRVEVTACPKDASGPFAAIASLIEGWSHGNLAALGARLSRAGLKAADIDATLRAFEAPSERAPVTIVSGADATLAVSPLSSPAHEAVVRFVQALLTEGRVGGPLLLAFDDADAMDSQSCSVLTQVLRESEDLRASVVFLSRHALPAELQSIDPRRMDVFELERDPADRLALGLLEANTAPRDLLNFFWDSSRGQPRLVECLVTSLRDAGHVRVQRGKATTAMALEAAALPLPIRMYFLSAYEQLKPLRRNMVDAVGVLGPLAKHAHVALVLKALGHDESARDIERSFTILGHRGLVRDGDPSALSPGLAADWATSLSGGRRRAVVLAALAAFESGATLVAAEEWLQVGDLAESVADLDTATRAYAQSLQIAREAALPREAARAASAAARVQREDRPDAPTHAELVKIWCDTCHALEAFEVAREANVLLHGLERFTDPAAQSQLALAIARALRGRDAESERAQALTYALAVSGHDAQLRAEVEAETHAITRQAGQAGQASHPDHPDAPPSEPS